MRLRRKVVPGSPPLNARRRQTAEYRNPRGGARLTRDYPARYGLPVLHGETYLRSSPAAGWPAKHRGEVEQLRARRAPVVGFTRFSRTDPID